MGQLVRQGGDRAFPSASGMQDDQAVEIAREPRVARRQAAVFLGIGPIGRKLLEQDDPFGGCSSRGYPEPFGIDLIERGADLLAGGEQARVRAVGREPVGTTAAFQRSPEASGAAGRAERPPAGAPARRRRKGTPEAPARPKNKAPERLGRWGSRIFGSAYGIRTRVPAVRGRRPRPLDECAVQPAARFIAQRFGRLQIRYSFRNASTGLTCVARVAGR